MADRPSRPHLEPIGPPRYCGKCGIRLNDHEVWRGGQLERITWEHPYPNADHEPEPLLLETELPPVGRCDFCSGPDPVWRYPCRAFEAPVVTLLEDRTEHYASADDWAACEPCHRLIESERWVQLANRSVERLPKEARAGTRKLILALHQRFQEHRTGPAVRETGAG